MVKNGLAYQICPNLGSVCAYHAVCSNGFKSQQKHRRFFNLKLNNEKDVNEEERGRESPIFKYSCKLMPHVKENLPTCGHVTRC